MILKHFICLLVPRLLVAQYVGVGVAHLSSTVDWQYPKPPSSCDFCVLDASPNASRESLAPAVVVQWRATRWLGLASEARYTQKGFASTQPTLKVNYLEVPLLLRVGKLVRSRSPISAFAEAGPAVALRLQCEVDYNGTADSCRNGAALGQDWRIRSNDVSAIAGFGAAFRIRDNLLIGGARVDWGLLDIGGGQGVPTKNRSTLLYLGWLWALSSTAR